MRLLLDTHTFLWFIEGSRNLGARATELIQSADNEVLLSTASLWEMAIKVSLNKLTIRVPFDVLMASQLSLNKIDILDITVEHIARVAQLPFYHRDPFDRMIIAQAIEENIPVVTADEAFDAYRISRLW